MKRTQPNLDYCIWILVYERFFPRSPRLLKGGLALLDPQNGAVLRIIPLQYNPDTLTRSLQIKRG